jgi:hypothetical protein
MAIHPLRMIISSDQIPHCPVRLLLTQNPFRFHRILMGKKDAIETRGHIGHDRMLHHHTVVLGTNVDRNSSRMRQQQHFPLGGLVGDTLASLNRSGW